MDMTDPPKARVGVRASRAAREALANIAARVGLSVAVTAAFVGFLGSCFVTEANAVVDARVYAARLAAQGYSILRVSGSQDSPEGLKGADCLGLAKVEGVQAQLWMSKAEDAHWFAIGGPPVPIRRTGGDILGFLSATNPDGVSHWSGAPILLDVSSDLATGKRQSFPVHLVQGASGRAVGRDAVLAFPTSLTMLGGGFEGNALLVSDLPAPNSSAESQSVESCSLVVREDERLKAKNAVSLVFSASRGYSVQWVMLNADALDPPRSRFETRPTRWLWLVGAIVFLAFWSLYLRLRRS